ncbi:hypothetical protein OG339_38135 [Streptosporangium sp. NBC_01495]|uniref:hypothetical protein n=1 Tax=Streptosporangium sp. NBC_01495 TaxID=2903899 RepID=UPI002E30F21D|nr:hypothetical protein [Streptosporangium sp. NBC_01495]
MRGQESGSEHQREAEGSAAPATPPPSFGQPSPHVLRTDLTGDEQPHSPSAWPEVTPGAAQPWTVPGDGAPYDWYAQPDDWYAQPEGDPPVPWPGPAYSAPQPGPLPYPEPSGPPRPAFSPGPPDPARPGFPPGPSQTARPDLPREPSGPRPEFPPGPPGATPPDLSRDPSGPRPDLSREPSAPRPEFSPGPSGPTWSEFSRPEPAPPAWINSPTPSEPAPPAWPAAQNPAGPPWPGAPTALDATSPAWPAEPAVPPRPGGTREGGRHEPGGSAPQDEQSLSTAPIVPGAPPWQPPPAFTAAAAGMQVWPSSGPEAPWPAATGEPVWTDPEESAARPGEPGDVAVWPPDAAPQQEPDENSDTTVDVRAAVPGTPGRPGPGDLLEPDHVPPPQQGPPTHQPPAQPSSGQAPQQAPPPPPAGPRDESPPTPSGPAPMAPMPAPVTQPVTRPEPELISQVPAPPFEQDTRDRTPPQTAGPGPAAQPFPPSDQATPPGGIPVVTGVAPSFPVLPPPPVTSSPAGEPPAPPGGGPATTRGAFTPLSEFVPEPPPPPPAPARSKASTTLLAAVVAVVVVGIGTGAFFAYQSFSAKQSANATDPIPSSGTLDPTDDLDITGEPEPINTTMLNSEKTDPGTMTVADAFGKKVSVAGTTFRRVKTNVTEQCQKAASGRFAGTLRSQECRRVLRATYVDSKRKYAVTTGIAVLPTRESAVAADKAKNLDSNLWFRGLPSAAGTGGERVHIAGGYAAGMVWGRYIVFSYATFSDGHTPTAKEKSLGKVSGAFRDQTAKVVERRVTN